MFTSTLDKKMESLAVLLENRKILCYYTSAVTPMASPRPTDTMTDGVAQGMPTRGSAPRIGRRRIDVRLTLPNRHELNARTRRAKNIELLYIIRTYATTQMHDINSTVSCGILFLSVSFLFLSPSRAEAGPLLYRVGDYERSVQKATREVSVPLHLQ